MTKCENVSAPSDPLAPPTSLTLSGGVGGGAKKRLVAPTLSLTLNQRDPQDPSCDSFSAAALSATDETPSLDINLDALETPSGSETGTLPDGVHDLEWEGESGRETGGKGQRYTFLGLRRHLTSVTQMTSRGPGRAGLWAWPGVRLSPQRV